MSAGYDKVPLVEMLDFFNGKAIKPGGEGKFPAYGSNGIIGGSDEHRFSDGIIIGRVGAYCGSVQYCPGKFWASDNTIVAKPKNDKFDVRYLFYLLNELKLNNYAGGAAQPLVTQTVLKQVEGFAPQIETQRNIASILSAYDDLIENNTRRIKILEEMARMIYREWFVNFCFPGHEKVKMVDSPHGMIPEGWEVVKVGNLLAKIQRKKKIQKQEYSEFGEIPVVDQGKDFIGGYTSDQEALIEEPLPLIVFGDHTRALKYIDFPFACGADGTQLLKANTPRMPTTLFYYALQEIDLSSFAYARHFKFLKEEQLMVPDKLTAEMFDKFVGKIRNHIRCLKKKNQNLRQTRDLLLPKLISGEIEV